MGVDRNRLMVRCPRREIAKRLMPKRVRNSMSRAERPISIALGRATIPGPDLAGYGLFFVFVRFLFFLFLRFFPFSCTRICGWFCFVPSFSLSFALFRRHVFLQAQSHLGKDRGQGFGFSLDDENITIEDKAARVRGGQTDTIADQGHDQGFSLVQHPLHFPQGFPFSLAVLGDAHFRGVDSGVKIITVGLFTRRHQSPADQDNEHQSGQGDG
jgi:hypothetical protein